MNPKTTPKILIVDDEELARDSIVRNLSRKNYTVVAVESGAKTLELLQNDPNFDVILLDIMMPFMDGFAVLKRLQSNPQTAAIKVIMLTALDNTDDKIKAFAAGAADYITKPFIPGELVARIDTQVRLKRTEATLRSQTQQYRTLLEQTNDVALILLENTNDLITKSTIDGQCVYASFASEKILGYTPAELVGLFWQQLVHPEDLKEIKAMDPPLLATTDPFVVTLRLRHKNGSYVWLEASIQPARTNPHERIAVARDVTERKRYEAELEQAYQKMEARVKERTTELIAANAHLKQEIIDRQRAEFMLEKERADLALRVEDRTAELSAANAELARANRLKDEFLASMSHELRTPLNAILGLAESLQEQIYGPLNPEQLNALHIIEESGRHLLTLINDILDLSKIGAGKLTLDITPINVQIITQASLRFIKQSAQKKHISVTAKIDPQVQIIQADQRRLKQILVNLLSNAVKFTPENGSIGLNVRGDKTNRVIHFTVWDTGIGIASKDMPHLFKLFVQLDSRLSRRYSGTGLGLGLVQQLTKLHGGSVAVTSDPGQGSRFTVTLPWQSDTAFLDVDANAANDTPSISASPQPPANTHILLVEDSPINVQTTVYYLKSRGYRVTVAGNGKEALQRIAEEKPSLILMDIQMPEMDGLEATRRIRANHSMDNVPIVAVTALAMPGDRERCLAAGANDYLSKPIRLAELNKIIGIYLNKDKDNGQ